MTMSPLTTDFSNLEKVGFDLPPVAVKFEYFKPEGVEPLDPPLAMCEMPRHAQTSGKVFYMDITNEDCMGKGAMGMLGEDPSWATAGLIGERMWVFKDPGANIRCMKHYTFFPRKSVNYIIFAPLPACTFEPDLLICTGDVKQVGAIMRAASYSTGDAFVSMSTPVFQCSWMFAYPFIENKVNYFTLGMGLGTGGRKAYTPGEMMVSVPRPRFRDIMESLGEMEIVNPAWQGTREEWIEKEAGIYAKLISDAEEAGLA